MVDRLESKLIENSWLGGDEPSKEDAEEFSKFEGNRPNCESSPNTYAWYILTERFFDDVRK